MVKMGTVWDRTAEFLTDNLTIILPVALLAYFVPLSIQGNFESVIDGARPQLVLTLRLISVAFGALATWGSLALVAMALDLKGDPGSIALRRLVPALIVSVTIFAALIAVLAPVAFALEALGYDPDTIGSGLSRTLEWPVAAYAVAALALCLWAIARLVVLNPVIVAEKRMFGALARSWKLSRGITWQVIGVTLLYAVVAIVAVIATRTVFGSVFQLVAGPDGGLSLPGVLTSVMVAAVQTGFTVVVPVFTAKLYQALASAARP